MLVDIADYVAELQDHLQREAYETARYCLIDTLGCGFEALHYPACTKLLGPIVPGTVGAQRREGAGHVLTSSIRSRRPSTSAP